MRDKTGRLYLTPDEAKPGIKVMVDADFGCLVPWIPHELVERHGELGVVHKDGFHGLDGQLSTHGDYYVGVYPTGH